MLGVQRAATARPRLPAASRPRHLPLHCAAGGRENFFHCDTCGACYATELRGNHVCVPDAMASQCPICCEYLFDSLEPPQVRAATRRTHACAANTAATFPSASTRTTALVPQVLRCGHTIHRKCLESYAEHGGFTCPLCSASVCDMQHAWLALDEEIRRAPMPAELEGKRVGILCNDCHEQAEAEFHCFGLRCGGCGSYNTRRT